MPSSERRKKQLQKDYREKVKDEAMDISSEAGSSVATSDMGSVGGRPSGGSKRTDQTKEAIQVRWSASVEPDEETVHICVKCKKTVLKSRVQLNCGHFMHQSEYDKWLMHTKMPKCPECDQEHFSHCFYCHKHLDKDDEDDVELDCGHFIHAECDKYWVDKDGDSLQDCPVCGKGPQVKCHFCKEVVGYGKYMTNCKNSKCNLHAHADELEDWLTAHDGLCPKCNNDHHNFCRICKKVLSSDDGRHVQLKCCENTFHKRHLDHWLREYAKCPRCNHEIGDNYKLIQRGGGGTTQALCPICNELSTEALDQVEMRCCQTKYHNKCLYGIMEATGDRHQKCPNADCKAKILKYHQYELGYYGGLEPRVFLGNECTRCCKTFERYEEEIAQMGPYLGRVQIIKGKEDPFGDGAQCFVPCDCPQKKWPIRCVICHIDMKHWEIGRAKCGCFICNQCLKQCPQEGTCRWCKKEYSYNENDWAHIQGPIIKRRGQFNFEPLWDCPAPRAPDMPLYYRGDELRKWLWSDSPSGWGNEFDSSKCKFCNEKVMNNTNIRGHCKCLFHKACIFKAVEIQMRGN